MTVHIVTDSSCDLTEADTSAHDIGVVPLSIRFGDQEFVDREQLSVESFYATMASTGILPETAAPSPGRFEQEFRAAAAARGGFGGLHQPVRAALGHRAVGRAPRPERSRASSTSGSSTACRSPAGSAPWCSKRRRSAAKGADADTIESLVDGHGPAHADLRRARHARQPQEGWPHRQRQGAARLDAVGEAD